MAIEEGLFHAAWKKVMADLEQQSWPQACLYVVATPIGNLADISLRAVFTLNQVDVIAAEDTRLSRVLLNAWGINTPMMPAHRHNEARAAQEIIRLLQEGKRVALISDAGAPAVSDPGGRIVREVRQQGLLVRPIPGASAVITALMGSGVSSDENPTFAFAGFVPQKSAARQHWLRKWGAMDAPVIMFESPHRIQAFCHDLLRVCGADRQLTVARELTKRFEQIVTLPIGELADWFGQDVHRQLGEFVLILEAAPEADEDEQMVKATELLKVLLQTVSVKDSVKIASQLTGLARDVVYSRALELKNA
ncbi:ribosomal RNA small subunit methyltransferase I [Advenella faeciporci]|uniref:Ribosomal RNA small subunit methyltransferase I n=2 Tax=Advenella faeciporci TaxID=797535 RepID=A0A918JL62_9BURK|nr:16S rRNA (cytidine(1402)-2'-O)-methyltransferase [Alcaligenaceae bacterium]GGW87379.1 ribosomal RNA small subunit methyltransferase I [Advenella faeciporci]